ncbi:N-acetylmuramidase family protein [Albibacterium profundi]|uniref:N-acetylmuramidase family protein n=1 Tax=Albibacterium profundi TaxID=3134906 RepID=A0ABV5CF23_9SPHI
MKKLTNNDVSDLACQNGIEYAALKAFIEVESGGRGFDPVTGKIIIQFEPSWFRKKAPYAPTGKWSLNGVERQSKEWIAFNDAFYKDPDAAMQATSIGLMQVMGFNYSMVGFKTVGEMWDFAKVSERNQLDLGVRFIVANRKLHNALIKKDWHLVAYYYNGEKYREMAKIWGREPYDISMQKAYNKYI